ncbi:porin family protein [Sulfurovum sp. zt1-1]|uniref:Porin family protein n=1 Tax=Sulfurovum zhangzhouensis TaxID=3019067 RepID=A0ABT7QX36_9BACT|nr:porin family protein [Sulfurovum zhangzhouensis]MDM5271394.1 porin family protein [Sulfurovum zhangzhouensis]
MKKLSLSIMACLAVNTFAVAGGNIEPVIAPVEEMSPVPDESGPYIGAGISFLTWNETQDLREPGQMVPIWQDFEESWTGGTILAGYRFNPYIAVEGRYTMSFTDGSVELDGADFGDYNDDLSNIAIYLKPMYPIGDFTLYALLGYGQTTIEFEGGGDHDDSDFQWGIGAGYNLTETLTAFIDYTVLYDDNSFDDSPSYISDIKADSITVGITYKF